MGDTATFTAIKDAIDQAKEILIVTHERPTFDSVGSSLTLFLGLTGLGKRVSIACPDPITVGLSSFVGANKVSTAIGKKNFVISLDYVEGSIEKVSYNIEGNKFNLIIEPRVGFPPFEQEKVHFSEASGDPDLIIVVDTLHLGGLKSIYEEHKEVFTDKTVVNIDHHANNSNFGHINFVDSSHMATAELIDELLMFLGLTLNQDMATNLLNALYGATTNFLVPKISANVFELAARCVKAGGSKFAPPPMPNPFVPQAGLPVGQAAAGMGRVQKPPIKSQFQYPYAGNQATTGVSAPAQSADPLPSVAPDQDAKKLDQSDTGVMPQSTAQSQDPATQESAHAPSDWLKPKIYKSSNVS